MAFGVGGGFRGFQNSGRPGAGNLNFQRGPGFRVNPGGMPRFTQTRISGPLQQGSLRLGGINPATQTRISGPIQQGQLQVQSKAPRINLGGGQQFRHLANRIAQHPGAGGRPSSSDPRWSGNPSMSPWELRNPNKPPPRVGGGGVIQLGGRGINPMRHPGALATTAGRRAANSGQPSVQDQVNRARQMGQRSYAPSRQRQNPLNRARQMGRGF